MKLKKTLALCLSLALLAMLAACSGGASSSAAPPAASEPSAESTPASDAGTGGASLINFYYPNELAVTMDPIMEAYKEVAPDMEIATHILPNDDYDDKLKVLMAGSAEELDVVWVRTPATIKQYIGTNTLEPLTSYAEASGVDLAPIRDTALVGCESEDGNDFFGLPISGSAWMLFYNKDLFDAKGLDYPINITWEEYRQLAIELTYEENGTKYWGGVIPPWTMNLGASSAGEYLTDAEPLQKTQDYSQMLYHFYTGDKSHLSIEEMSSGMFDIHASFGGGNIAMMINGDWTFRLQGETEFEYCAAPLPIFEGLPEGSTVGQHSYLAVSASSSNKQASYDFIEFALTSDTGTGIIATTDVPSYATDAAMAIYQESVTVPGVEYRFSARVNLEQGTDPNYSAINDAFKAELQLYLLDEQDLDTCFTNFFALREEILS